MKESIEYLKEIDQNTRIGIAIVTYLIFTGLKSLILAARGIDDDK